MTNIETEWRFELLGGHADSCTPEELFENYKRFFRLYKEGDCTHNTARFGDCLWYLKKLVTKFRPEIGMLPCLREVDTFHPVMADIEHAYIHYLLRVAKIENTFSDSVCVALFAKKTLDMVDYFNPCLNQLSKQWLIKEHPVYSEAQKLFNENKEAWVQYLQYYPEAEANLFRWEIEQRSNTKSANQNIKYRLHW